MPVELLQAPSPELPEDEPREPRRGRRVVALLMLALIATALATRSWDVIRGASGPSTLPDGWVEVGTVEDVRTAGVMRVPGHDIFVVDTQDGPIALSSRSPHLGAQIRFCRTSGWFEDPAGGSKFDALGFYADGPAPRGMDRVAARVRDGFVDVDPRAVTLGAPRDAGPVLAVAGPFCEDVGRG